MEWFKFKDKMPKIQEDILISSKTLRGILGNYTYLAFLIRPFDKDKKFNPDYTYLFIKGKEGHEIEFPEKHLDLYWSHIALPFKIIEF